MRITIEPDMEGERGGPETYEEVFEFVVVGQRRGPFAPMDIRRSYVRPKDVYGLIEKLEGMKCRLLHLDCE